MRRECCASTLTRTAWRAQEHPAVTARSAELVDKFRAEKQITVAGRDPPKPCQTFEEGSFPDYILSVVEKEYGLQARELALQNVYVCMNVCMDVSMFVCMYVCMYVHAYLYICTCMYTLHYTHTLTHTHTHSHSHTHTHTHTGRADASASTGVAGGSIGQGLHQCRRDGLGQDLGVYAPVYRAH